MTFTTKTQKLSFSNGSSLMIIFYCEAMNHQSTGPKCVGLYSPLIEVNMKAERTKETFWVHSFDQGICTYVRVTLCTPEKGRLFPFPFFSKLHWKVAPPSLILLPILFVSLQHSALMSCPSYLAGKGESSLDCNVWCSFLLVFL